MLFLGLLVHRAPLVGFPPRRVGLMLTARKAQLHSWRVGRRMVCGMERPRHLMYLFLTRVQVLSCRFGFFSWHRYQCSELPIPKTHPVRRCPLWLVVIVAASVLMAGVPNMISACRPLTKGGWMSPPAERRRCLGGFPTRTVAHLGLLVLL
jgi:hypothetical protein